jgi:hypothetical protein
MKTRSPDQGRTAGVGSVKRPSPGFGAMGETRRLQTFPPLPPNGEVRSKVIKRTGFLDRLKAANAWQHGLDHYSCGDLRLLGTRQSVVAGIHRYDEVVGG